jgi:hypothetical protein
MTERSFLFARLPTTTKLLQPNSPQEIPGRSAKGGLGFLFRIKTMSRMHRCSMQSPLDIIHWNLVGAPCFSRGSWTSVQRKSIHSARTGFSPGFFESSAKAHNRSPDLSRNAEAQHLNRSAVLPLVIPPVPACRGTEAKLPIGLRGFFNTQGHQVPAIDLQRVICRPQLFLSQIADP